MENFHLNFAGYVAVVTGGSSGIGLAVSKAFLLNGAKVINWDICESLESEQLYQAYPDRYLTVIADVTDEASLNRATSSAIAAFEKIDIVVNCAGIIVKAPIEKIDMNAWDKIFNVNLKGTVLVCQKLTPYLKKSGHGRIINISSMTAIIGLETYSPYSTTKAAVSNFSKVLALELAPYGITVNAINPGWVETPMLETGLIQRIAMLHHYDKETARSEILKFVPQHRFIQPEEIAFSVLFLSSRLAQGISATELRIDCGLTNTFTPGFHQVI